MNNRHVLVIQGGDKHYEIIDYLKGFSILTIVVMHLLQIYIASSLFWSTNWSALRNRASLNFK